MQAFIVRPFGVKGGIDFEAVHRQLIAPALRAAGIAGDAAGQFFEAGNIREDMFQQLLLADLVIADISLHNPNVFYELGIRHALRGRQTFLIRAKLDDVPFDLKTDRYLEYDAADPAASVEGLVRGLLNTKASERIDSPVFRALPKLREPARDDLVVAPLGFVNDVECAAERNERGKLGLLAWESRRCFWELSGLRLAGRAQFKLSLWGPARETWERIFEVYPDDLETNLRLGTIYQRLGDLARSDGCVQRALAHPRADADERSEALALAGRNEKIRWMEQCRPLEPAARRAATMRSGYFSKARHAYQSAFRENLNHYYSGLNALSLNMLLLDVVAGEQDAWSERFESEEEARENWRQLREDCERLAAAVGLSLATARTRLERGAADDWTAIAEADYRFLTASRDGPAAAAYERALAGAAPLQIAAARSQLDLFRQLGVRAERVETCLLVFPEQRAEAPPRQAILFTGHMVDAAGRPQPRFPASHAEAARCAIESAVRGIVERSGGSALGIAGGANGGDILFHEVCHRLGIPTRVLLTLPPGQFISESVAPGGEEWVKRFNALAAAAGDAMQILGASKELPRWMRDPADYNVWQRTNVWILQEGLAAGAAEVSLIAFWDGQSGDGPGGTAGLVRLAAEYGVGTFPLITREVFQI